MASVNVSLPTLHLGSRDPAVAEAQRLLNKAGMSIGVRDPAGIFGPLTLAEVKKFQSSMRMQSNGVVDAQTWTQLYVIAGEAKFVAAAPTLAQTVAARPAASTSSGLTNGPPVPGTGMSTKTKVVLAGAAAIIAYVVYARLAKKPGLLVAGYDDAGDAIEIGRERPKKKRKSRAMGADDQRRGMPRGEENRVYRSLRRQREMYPNLDPDPVNLPSEARMRRMNITKSEWEALTHKERTELLAEDAATRSKWAKGHKQSNVTRGEESNPNEGTMTVPGRRGGRTAVLTKRDFVYDPDEDDMVFVETPLPSELPLYAPVRLEADPKMWKSQKGYREDMRRLAREHAQANDRPAEVFARGTKRVLFTTRGVY